MSSTAAVASSGGRLRSLDALRGIACLMVALNHTFGIPGGAAPGEVADLEQLLLDAGLALFFVISGYLISQPYVRSLIDGSEAPSLGGYAIRRTMRIGPAYWVAILLTLGTVTSASALMQYNGATDMTLTPFDWLSAMLFFQTWVQGSHAFTALPVIWTIPVEIAFYLAVPVLYALAGRLRRHGVVRVRTLAVAIAGLWIGALLLQILYFRYPGTTYGMRLALSIALFHVSFLSSFCPGILIAVARTKRGRVEWRRATDFLARPEIRGLAPTVIVALFLTGFALWHIGDRGTTPLGEWRRPLNAVSAAIAVWVALGAGGRVWRLIVRALAPVGTVSYGLFLFHWVVLRELFDHGWYPVTWLPEPLALLGKGALCLLFALPLAAVSWYALERPALRWSARLAQRLDDRRAAPAPVLLREAG
jgi:peptidoglycan/LPS O-acetylase OafA/YrhL